jgi:universal stress protein A
MLSVQTILYPTDFSSCSDTAFPVACSLARDNGARLVVLHVTPTSSVYGGTFPGVPTNPEMFEHALEERLRQIQPPALEPNENGASIRIEHVLKTGHALEEIVRTADETGSELIVMGTHGRTGLGRALMGSVAEAVLRTAHCPVLIVRSSASKASAGHAPANLNPISVS